MADDQLLRCCSSTDLADRKLILRRQLRRVEGPGDRAARSMGRLLSYNRAVASSDGLPRSRRLDHQLSNCSMRLKEDGAAESNTGDHGADRVALDRFLERRPQRKRMTRGEALDRLQKPWPSTAHQLHGASVVSFAQPPYHVDGIGLFKGNI